MTYFTCAVFSVLLLFLPRINKVRDISDGKTLSGRQYYNFVFLVLLFFWTFLIGLQYEVGTDYNSYKVAFTSLKGRYENKGELLFHYLTIFVSKNLHYQFGFIICAFLQFLCFFLFLKKIKLTHNYLFIFLFFFACVAFYNQTNLVRQYTSAYLILLAWWFAYKRELIRYIILVAMAGMFHVSAWMCLPIYFFTKIKLSERWLFAALFVSVSASFINIDKVLNMIIPYTHKGYLMYLTHEAKSLSIINWVSKLIFIPFYFLSLLSFKHLCQKDKFFFCWGFVSYCIVIIGLTSFVLHRMAVYFSVLSIFPLYYLLAYLLRSSRIAKTNRMAILFIFVSIMVSMLFTKTVLFPGDGEYAYKSIFSQYF
ncbi:MAG: EpsG family protein [Chitinispirillales bacterium]|jgi:hypothetical protein|nr:EpsG family protein [Chitinispirillales bacterium]